MFKYSTSFVVLLHYRFTRWRRSRCISITKYTVSAIIVLSLQCWCLKYTLCLGIIVIQYKIQYTEYGWHLIVVLSLVNHTDSSVNIIMLLYNSDEKVFEMA